MTTYDANNVFNIAIKGSFDDCQKIVKDMFVDKEFSNHINMSGVNSINWARIIAQIVYYFYIFYKCNIKKLYCSFSSHRKFWRCLRRICRKTDGLKYKKSNSCNKSE